MIFEDERMTQCRDWTKKSLNIYVSKSKWVYNCTLFRFVRICDNGRTESDFIRNFIPVTSRFELFIRYDEKVSESRGSNGGRRECGHPFSLEYSPAPIRPRKSYAENFTPGFRGNFTAPIVDHSASQYKNEQAAANGPETAPNVRYVCWLI